MSAAERYDLEEFAGMDRACGITGLSRSTIYRMIREKTFPAPIKVGGRKLWPVSRLHGWVNAQISAAEALPAAANE